MKIAEVEVTGTIKFNYDPESEEFKNTLESYRQIYDDNADEKDVLQHAAFSLVRFGEEHFIEALGYVCPKYITPKEFKKRYPDRIYSGIQLMQSDADEDLEYTVN